MCGIQLRVKGKVQGVGFRPFVWQLAHQLNINGEVLNDGQGVLIRLENRNKLATFQDLLLSELPPLAQIDSLHTSMFDWQIYPSGFSIVESESTSIDTQIVPDASTCPDCLFELYQHGNNRHLYPFINCTHCGPRFTIIKQLPYDRPKTVMKDFPLCQQCHAEYKNPADRRYHAQPVACPDCGPSIWLTDKHGQILNGNWLTLVTSELEQGNIVAIKSIGGFHLACDATSHTAVQKLRDRKHRQNKPFAVMAESISHVHRLAHCSDHEEKMLTSRIAPITLLKQHDNVILAANVAPNLVEIGLMLPSNPVQHLIASAFAKPLVMTSGNRSGLPPALTNEDAVNQLHDIADLFVLHDREIIQRCDDSLVRVDANGQQETLRRSRGLIPDAIKLPEGFPGADGYFAFGGDLKSAFAFGKGDQIIVSQYLGDLANIETQTQFKQAIEHYQSIYQLQPNYYIVDKHPGYFSHQYAYSSSERVIEVQHHHAHVASCLLENRWQPESGNVLALILDGLGYGDDGELWGGELLLANYTEYQVIGGLPSIELIGGDNAARQPWRSLFSHYKTFLPTRPIKELEALIAGKPLQMLDTALNQSINTHKIRSAGRFFDAVAASLGICVDDIEYEGQAACQLEALASGFNGRQESKLKVELNNLTLDLTSFWQQWLSLEAPRTEKAYLFHLYLANTLATMVKQAKKTHPVNHLVLSGGVFHNKLLTSLVKDKLENEINILQHQQYSCGDGGLALGQLAIALCKNKHTE